MALRALAGRCIGGRSSPSIGRALNQRGYRNSREEFSVGGSERLVRNRRMCSVFNVCSHGSDLKLQNKFFPDGSGFTKKIVIGPDVRDKMDIFVGSGTGGYGYKWRVAIWDTFEKDDEAASRKLKVRQSPTEDPINSERIELAALLRLMKVVRSLMRKFPELRSKTIHFLVDESNLLKAINNVLNSGCNIPNQKRKGRRVKNIPLLLDFIKLDHPNFHYHKTREDACQGAKNVHELSQVGSLVHRGKASWEEATADVAKASKFLGSGPEEAFYDTLHPIVHEYKTR